MSETKNFPLGHILSITTGRLVCETEPPIKGVYEILDFMSGDRNYTHQLPRVSKEARPVLLDAHPQLLNVDISTVSRGNWKEWVDTQKKIFGAELAVPKMNAGQHARRDPISELAEMTSPERVVVIGI